LHIFIHLCDNPVLSCIFAAIKNEF
jgi:hypothetical protein